MKVKAKLKGDVVKVKVLAKHVNAGPEEAEKKKIEAIFITSVIAKANDKLFLKLLEVDLYLKTLFSNFNSKVQKQEMS